MAAVGHFEIYFFNGLAYNAAQYMVSGVFWVEEFIFDLDLMIWPIFYLQIQNGGQYGRRKLKNTIEIANILAIYSVISQKYDKSVD